MSTTMTSLYLVFKAFVLLTLVQDLTKIMKKIFSNELVSKVHVVASGVITSNEFIVAGDLLHIILYHFTKCSLTFDCIVYMHHQQYGVRPTVEEIMEEGAC